MSFSSVLRINPFGRLLLFYIAGILLASLFSFRNQPVILAVIFLITLLLLAAILYMISHPNFLTDRRSGIIAGAMLISAGFFNYSLYSFNGQLIGSTAGFKGTIVLEINEPVIETKKTVKCISRVREVICGSNKHIYRQKIITYFAKDSLAKDLKPGDRIIGKLEVTGIDRPLNPDEFDYSRYLTLKKVYNQAFIPASSWRKIDTGKSLKALSFRFQGNLINLYRRIGLNNTLFSILSAITLGYKNDLDSQTLQAFSKAGVMHVMALSGFNVAVIAFALNYLLFFMDRFRYGIMIKTILIVLVIWLFAFITGLSPSVLRASVMISMVLTGKAIHRNLSIINVLYGSAFILLTITPALIYDVSFQLSFAAVFGILVFHPWFGRLIKFRYSLANKVWQLFSVSCAAQLATMPLTLFYFHQFPVYFWLTNLYVIPLVSIIICTSGLYLMFSFINPLMVVLGKIIALLLSILYESIVLVEVMPFSLIENISLSTLQLIGLIFLLAAAGLYIHYKRFIYVLAALALVALFQIVSVLKANTINNQRILLVGHLKNQSVINLIEGRNSFLLTSTDTGTSVSAIYHPLANFWIKHGVAGKIKVSQELRDENTLLFTFAGKRCMIINNSPIGIQEKNVDFLIITGKVKINRDILSSTDPEIVILDSSVSVYWARKWISICNEFNINCWAVSLEGAWILENSFINQQHQYLALK